MTKNLKTLFKKEFYEIRYNYRVLASFIILLSTLYAPSVKNSEQYLFILFLSVLLIVQMYIYVSYNTEAKYGGAVFISNMNYNFFQIFFTKLSYSCLLVTLMLFINMPNFMGRIKIIDLIFLIPLIAGAVSITHIAATFSKGAEETSMMIASLINITLLIALKFISVIILRILASIAIAIVSVYISYSVSKSIMYRSQL